ncbi:MAG TPA: hypothetical protein VKA00_01250 [Trueperaceae bacterium]|nr:hypothetical protein [Trueperaceae bacterium]
MRTLKMLAGVLTLVALTFVLSSCGTSSAPLSFSILVPSGVTAHATLQGSDGHVISTQAFDAGTKEVTFTDAPANALVTISMYAPNTNANTEKDYYNLTAPASIVAGHQVLFVQPIDNYIPVTVTLTCPSSAASVHWMTSGFNSGTASCTSGTFSANTYSSSLQSDGTMSMALIAYDSSSNPVAYATKLDQNVDAGAFTISASDWSSSAPPTNTSQVNFATLPANQSATWNLEAFVSRRGQPFDVQASNPSASTTSGSTLSVSAPAVPVSGATYNIIDGFTQTYSDSSGLSWTSNSMHGHQVSSLPVNETVTAGTGIWPTLNDAHWVNNGGSPTLTYQSNSGTSAATFAMANVFEVDNTSTPTVARSWTFFGNPSAFSGTFQFPDLPSSLSAYVPTPVASTAGSNSANVAFSDIQPVLYSSSLFGLIGSFGSFPVSLLYGFMGNVGIPASFHIQAATTNHITTSAVHGASPATMGYIGLR